MAETTTLPPSGDSETPQQGTSARWFQRLRRLTWEGSANRQVVTVCLLVYVVGAVLGLILWRMYGTAESSAQQTGVQTGAVATSPAQALIERDRTRACIPLDPVQEQRCDPIRLALWENRDDALVGYLRQMGVAAPTTTQMLELYGKIHVEAGDLDSVAAIAQRAGRAEVRVTAVQPSSSDPAREYVEIQNVGGGSRELRGLELRAPSSANAVGRAPVFTFAGTLAPAEGCRVYTRAAAQSDLCVGNWGALNRGVIWPASGAVVTLHEVSNTSGPRIADRWLYTAERPQP